MFHDQASFGAIDAEVELARDFRHFLLSAAADNQSVQLIVCSETSPFARVLVQAIPALRRSTRRIEILLAAGGRYGTLITELAEAGCDIDGRVARFANARCLAEQLVFGSELWTLTGKSSGRPQRVANASNGYAAAGFALIFKLADPVGRFRAAA